MKSEGDLASWAYILLLSNPLGDCGGERLLRCVRPEAPTDPPRPGEMERSCGGSVELGQWAC